VITKWNRWSMSLAPKIRHLQVFLAVAKAGSMQRAARDAHLTQPAISKMIVELENIFRAPLFERGKRGVVPTECGRALIGRAQLVLNDLDSAKEEIAAIASGVIGRVRVGVLPVADTRLLSTTLLALRKMTPGLVVQIEDGTREVMLNALRRGEIDCVIGRLDAGAGDRDLHIEKLIQSPVAIVVSSSHVLARKKRLSWTDLLPYPWISPPIGAPIRTAIDREFTDIGLTPPIPAIESTSSRLIRAVVSETDMIGVITHEASLSYARNRELAALPVKLSARLPHIGVITRQQVISSALGLFLTALRQQCKSAPKRV
jgi:DNA-binding transcriptional LysR family regulator